MTRIKLFPIKQQYNFSNCFTIANTSPTNLDVYSRWNINFTRINVMVGISILISIRQENVNSLQNNSKIKITNWLSKSTPLLGKMLLSCNCVYCYNISTILHSNWQVSHWSGRLNNIVLMELLWILLKSVHLLIGLHI